MKKILVIGYVWPEPTASAAGVRMLQLIRFFRERDDQVHFATPAQRPGSAFKLEKMGVSTRNIEVNDNGFNTFITDLAPDLVLFDRFMMEEQFAWRVAECCPEAIRILDTEDLHFLRKYRQKKVTDQAPQNEEELLDDALAKREIAAIYRCDLSLIVSEREMELLHSVFRVPSNLLAYHPIFTEDGKKEERGMLPDFNTRKDLMFIGNFLHAPNADAVRVLENGLWDKVRKELPEAQLHIYGAYMADHYKIRKTSKNGIHFHGRATDVDTVMKKMRLLIAPLRYGAGLKGKLIRAMENGLPSVTTSLGAEGIAGDLEWGGAVSALDTSFVTAVKDLYNKKEYWNIAVERGFHIVDTRFCRKPFEHKLAGRINALLLDPGMHRRHNFTGQMLMDQRCMAARYLSKYIMAKNTGR